MQKGGKMFTKTEMMLIRMTLVKAISKKKL